MNKKFVRALEKKLDKQQGQPVLVLYAGHSPAIGFVSGTGLEVNESAGSVTIPTRGHIVYDEVAQRPLKQSGNIPLGGMIYRLANVREHIFIGRADIAYARLIMEAELRMGSYGKLVDVVTIGTAQLDRRIDRPYLHELVESMNAKKRTTIRRQILLVRALLLATQILKSRHRQ